jgi:HK97 family phage major capsid protein
MAPKTVAAYVDISRKLRLQSSPDAEMIFRDDMVRGCAVAVDAVGIEGGATNQPTGILQTAGIGSVTIATNGGAPTWATVVNLVREVEVDNGDLGDLAYLMNPKVKSKLSQTVRVSSTDSRMILDEPWNSLYGYPFAVTNGVPSDLTKGGGSSLSALLFGNFSDVIIGQWGNGVDVLADPYTLSASGGVRVTVFLDTDIGIRNPVSFAACQEIVTT